MGGCAVAERCIPAAQLPLSMRFLIQGLNSYPTTTLPGRVLTVPRVDDQDGLQTGAYFKRLVPSFRKSLGQNQ
jgi:hypothetical protein